MVLVAIAVLMELLGLLPHIWKLQHINTDR